MGYYIQSVAPRGKDCGIDILMDISEDNQSLILETTDGNLISVTDEMPTTFHGCYVTRKVIGKVKMTVGIRRRTHEKVQYCITAIPREKNVP